MELIHNIETLRGYVKLNASTDWNTYRPFVQDAQDKFITPYFGIDLLETVSADETDKLREYILRALAPFSLALATHELSINFGETGHTVARTDKLAPASETKIMKAVNSLLERAWYNLDEAIRYATENESDYSNLKSSRLIGTALFENYKDFQDNGLVDINYSPLTFSRLRMLIVRVEKTETLILLPPDLDYLQHAKLKPLLQAFTASRVAELQTNTEQKSNLHEAPPIQLLQDAGAESKNYYTKQSVFWKGKIDELLIEDGLIEDSRQFKVNDYNKTVFVATGGRL